MAGSAQRGAGQVALLVQPGEKARESSSAARWTLDVRVSPFALAVFTRQLATMYHSGISLPAALEALAHQTEDVGLAFVLMGVHWEVEKGKSLSGALLSFPMVFNPLYVAFVREGETVGDLDSCLEEVAAYLEGEWRMACRLKALLSYFGVVLGAAAGVGILLLHFIMPFVLELLADVQGTLPWTTRALLVFHGVTDNLVVLMCTVFLAIWLVLRLLATRRGRRLKDRVLLEVPLVGPVVRHQVLSRVARALGSCIEAGLPLRATLEVASRVAGNELFCQDLLGARESVLVGKPLSQHFMKQKRLYTPTFAHMMAVGEAAGTLDGICRKLSKLHELRVESSLLVLIQLLEPAVVTLTGFFVGLVALGVFEPLYGLIFRLQ